MYESGYGTSNLARNHNNYIGFKFPKSRTTTAIGQTKSGFAKYSSLRDCLLDFRIWQLYYTKGMSREQFKNYLNKNYSDKSNYFEKLLELWN